MLTFFLLKNKKALQTKPFLPSTFDCRSDFNGVPTCCVGIENGMPELPLKAVLGFQQNFSSRWYTLKSNDRFVKVNQIRT